mmetsp:Transcript_23791/g.36774  ORF Transcript_23791/g.36774 Transcript_23791/m.36774 type:complete len:97 (+) Transcript_23791:96-386(+)
MNNPLHPQDTSTSTVASLSGSALISGIFNIDTRNCTVPESASNIITGNTVPPGRYADVSTQPATSSGSSASSAVDYSLLYSPAMEWFQGIQVRPLE